MNGVMKMQKPKIVLIGGGGHCKVVINILNSLSNFEIYGITDNKENIGKKILGVTINSTDEDLSDIKMQGVEYAFITLGITPNSKKRLDLISRIKSLGFKIPSIISKYAIVASSAEIGEGTLIEDGAIVDPCVVIGDHCIINKACVISHDVIIENNVNLSPGCLINGNSLIKENAYVGTGGIILQGLEIGENTTVGAGAVVTTNVEDNVIAIGIPAKIRELKR